MAVVSNNPVIATIHSQLASSLGLEFGATTDDRGKAELLFTRFKNNNKRILVILDDLWEGLNLQSIGIPVGGKSGRIKVLLTSRDKEVCSHMRATTLEVDVLPKEESWCLFMKVAEISGEANDIKDIAEKVAKECGGLPLAIVIVSKALKNKQNRAWGVALHQLQQASVTIIRGMNKYVYSSIKLSYDYLESADSKELLLLCSLFPEDYNIQLEDLVRYVKGLHLFRNVVTIEDARDIVFTVIDQLKSCYLLLDGDEEKRVKLHDIVRDVCLSISSSGEHMHMVRHGGLKEWPQEDKYASSSAISITFDKIDHLSSGFEYPNLKLLKLSFPEQKLHMHEDFFKWMKEIKVLELSNLNGELPSSLQLLVNLRTLSLHHCRLYGDISVIGHQKKLEILSFYNSYLQDFPDKISELSNLKSLDLRFAEGPPLPSGTLVRLEKLEELYLGSYYQEWKRKGEDAYSVITTEISSLVNLQTIQFCAYDNHCLEQFLQKLHAEKLMRFEVTRTTYNKVGKYQFGSVMNLEGINVDCFKMHAAQCLLSRTEELELDVKGLTNLVGELDGNGFVNLKKLYLHSCDLKCLIDPTSFHTSGGGAFINLETLVIGKAKNMEELCGGNLPLGSFTRLRKVNLYGVPALRRLWGAIEHPCLGNLGILDISGSYLIRSLFLQSSLKCLCQVQQINISECPKLETIVSNDEEDDEVTRDVVFPKLESLTLHIVRSFRSFGPKSSNGVLFGKVILPNLESLAVKTTSIRCIVDDQTPVGSLSKLRTINIESCRDFVHVSSSVESIKLFQSLQELSISFCQSLEVVFDFTGLNVEGAESLESPLTQLESMKLEYLRKLKHICRMFPEEIHAFKNLRSLCVFSCDSLRYLLSPSMAKALVGLETLELSSCEKVEAIIGVEIESKEYTVKEKKKDGEESTNKIVFPKLKKLEVKNLNNFQMLCSVNADLELPSLTELTTYDCPKMPNFCVGRLSETRHNNVQYDEDFSYFCKEMLPSLETLSIYKINGIRCIVDGQMPTGSLSKLRAISIKYCDDLVHVAASVNSIKLLQSLQLLELGEDRSLEVVFDFTGVNVEGAESLESPLVRLESLDLVSLPNLKHICRMLPEGIQAFKNLRSLSVSECNSLRYLLSPSMAKMLVTLQTLTVSRCNEIEAIIGREESDVTEIESDKRVISEGIVKKKDGEESTNKIVLPNLRSIKLVVLHKLRMLCSVDVELEFPSLTELEIFYCAKLPSPTRLSNVIKYDEKTIASDDFISWLQVMFPKLEALTIRYMHGIRCIVDVKMPNGSLSKLRTIKIMNCDGLVHVAASVDSIKLLQSLKHLSVEKAELLEVVFDFNGLNVEGAESIESLLDRLESLKLEYLPKLKHICPMLPEGIHAFRNLRSLDV